MEILLKIIFGMKNLVLNKKKEKFDILSTEKPKLSIQIKNIEDRLYNFYKKIQSPKYIDLQCSENECVNYDLNGDMVTYYMSEFSLLKINFKKNILKKLK